MNRPPLVFIFIGKSGSGKGTQVEQLAEFLKHRYEPKLDIVYLQTGKEFRQFIEGGSYTQKKSRKIILEGGLQPEFLAINMWSSFFIREMKPNAHVIIDGTPRKPQEAVTLDSAVQFYGWNRPHVVHLAVSHGVATERLLKRGRMDDTPEDIKSRLGWFETDVMKAVDYYRENSGYFFHNIDGDQSVEAVHKDILRECGLTQ